MTWRFVPAVALCTIMLSLGVGVQIAHAVPFDAIVPTLYHVGTQNHIGTAHRYSALIAATTNSLNTTDLDNIVFTATETDPLVDVIYGSPVNTHILTNIDPGEVIGRSLIGTTFANLTATMDALVLPGETHLSPGIGYVGISTNYPVNHIGTVTVNASITSGSDLINFTYDIVYGDFPDSIKVVSAQRLSSVPKPVLLGDLDNDGFVGITDLNLVLSNWNQNVPPANPAADPSGDNFIGIEDLNIVLGNWNAGTPPGEAANIPEPGTLGLTVLCLAGMAGRKHRGLRGGLMIRLPKEPDAAAGWS